MTGDRLLARIATFGLIGTQPLLDQPVAEPRWQALLGEAFNHKMEGVLAASVAAGALPVTHEQMSSLREAVRFRASADLLVERQTVRAAAILQAAGVPYRLLKGPSWAHRYYADPSLRGFGDVDVLVAPSFWEDAVRALTAAGSKRLYPEVRPGFDARFGKDATFVSPAGWEIDLHRTLVVGPYGLWIETDSLFSRPAAHVFLGGQPLAVLDTNAAFLHACYNAALGDDPPRLSALRDVAQIARAVDIDPDEAFSLARRWRGVGVVRQALRMVSERLAVPLDGTTVGERFSGTTSRRDRVLLASYRGAGRGYTSQLAGTVAVRGLRAKSAYLAALVLPQKEYLDARGFGLASFLRHGLRRVRTSR